MTSYLKMFAITASRQNIALLLSHHNSTTDSQLFIIEHVTGIASTALATNARRPCWCTNVSMSWLRLTCVESHASLSDHLITESRHSVAVT